MHNAERETSKGLGKGRECSGRVRMKPGGEEALKEQLNCFIIFILPLNYKENNNILIFICIFLHVFFFH